MRGGNWGLTGAPTLRSSQSCFQLQLSSLCVVRIILCWTHCREAGRKLTSDEIKAKYGRKKETAKAQSDIDGASAQMAQNRDKLMERGQKLDRMTESMNIMVQARDVSQMLCTQQAKASCVPTVPS